LNPDNPFFLGRLALFFYFFFNPFFLGRLALGYSDNPFFLGHLALFFLFLEVNAEIGTWHPRSYFQ
jgi:hypothetical protein